MSHTMWNPPSDGALMRHSGLDSVPKQLIILFYVASIPPHLQPNWRFFSRLGCPLSPLCPSTTVTEHRPPPKIFINEDGRQNLEQHGVIMIRVESRELCLESERLRAPFSVVLLFLTIFIFY